MGGALLFEGSLRARTVPFSSLPNETIISAAGYIGENLREADREEIKAMMTGDPADIVIRSALASTVGWIMLDRDGDPVGILGAAPQGVAGVGVPWLVGTPDIQKEYIALARQTVPHVDIMLEAFPVLTNHVDARNNMSLDWLLWAGFDLIDANTNYGPEGRLFLQFLKAR